MSHNKNGNCAKEQEEPPVCWLRYLPFFLFFVLFVCAGMVTCLLQGNQSYLSQNKQIMLFLKAEMGRLAHTPPVIWQLTVVSSRHVSIHPCVSLLEKMKGHVLSEPLPFK